MFRVMDPVSQRMMGLRTDITLQVARIAATRLRDAARPLRLAYAGQVLRVRGSQLRPERQFAQAGFELIGRSEEHTSELQSLMRISYAVFCLKKKKKKKLSQQIKIQ